MVSMTTHTPPFLFIANNIAIDFANTLITDRGTEVDLLENSNGLFNWATEAGFSVEKLKNTDNDQLTLKKTKELRAAIKNLVEATIDNRPTPQDSLVTLNRWLPKGVIEQHLIEQEGKLTLSPLHSQLSVEILLGQIATEAAYLLSSPKITKLKCCSNPQCVLTFLDISRSGKRKWCSMDICGNRAKAATFYSSVKHTSK